MFTLHYLVMPPVKVSLSDGGCHLVSKSMADENTAAGENGGLGSSEGRQGEPGAPGKLLRNLVFLPWVQYPPLPRVPDLSDPSSFKWKQVKD